MILYKRVDPELYVDNYFTKEMYLRTYGHVIRPIPDQVMWPSLGLELINPPLVHRRVGRPKKLRRREADEPRSTLSSLRVSGSLRCRNCGHYGHNRRTCQGGPVTFIFQVIASLCFMLFLINCCVLFFGILL